ncbi:hypothetical protein ElyMa_002961900 [Elysia marginata]|uniref:Uncharacterized protein n=1 Tax=Elysia marginata TaxID=1093978 RepID=A0AAV4I7C1_9GAST|nr:hypothetical protein ElyMa_002961900 [Elysia marginata]
MGLEQAWDARLASESQPRSDARRNPYRGARDGGAKKWHRTSTTASTKRKKISVDSCDDSVVSADHEHLTNYLTENGHRIASVQKDGVPHFRLLQTGTKAWKPIQSAKSEVEP